MLKFIALLFVAATTEALAPGSTVTVIGASGNVGKLVALRLSESYKVRGVVRDATRVRSFLPESVDLYESDLRKPGASLEAALSGAEGLVICTGTTAFPTKAWSESGRDGVAFPVLKALADAGFDRRAAVDLLTERGLNTPQTVDERGTLDIIEAWGAASASRRRLVLLSSVGVRRRAEMPYPILNACGVLDAKAAAEDAIEADAKAGGYDYTIVRPSQLFGGPYDNNVYLGTLFQLDKDADTREVLLGRGDVTMNDDPQLGTLRSTLAEVIASALEASAAKNLDFTVVNGKGEFPSPGELKARLAAL
mmetsp:Transcript_27433/g.82344  ORF Transcript_27433/g.82344 Transcript_27433/m.82344 type:complete len:308 (-) Transcript_27433:25-948(-)